jgi:hypothetical protein
MRVHVGVGDKQHQPGWLARVSSNEHNLQRT